MVRFRILGMLLALSAAIATVPASAVAAGSPVVMAQYDAWFDGNSWGKGDLSDVRATPYSSAYRATIERHVCQAESAGIDVLSLNWWGPGNPTDANLQTLLSVARAQEFKVTVTEDLNTPVAHNVGDTTNQLNYLKRYFDDPAWFRYDGKPMVVCYGTRSTTSGLGEPCAATSTAAARRSGCPRATSSPT